MKRTSLTTLMLAATLLASPAFGQDAPATAAAQETPAPTAEPVATANAAPAGTSPISPKVLNAIGAPKEGKGQIVVFRPSKFAGAAIKYKVREGEKELGQLSNGRYFVVQVEPGPHTYVVHSEAKDVTNIEVEAGETYFLVGSVSMGFMAGRPNLSPSDAAAFEAVMGKMTRTMLAE